MKLSWGDEVTEQFISNIGLITSDGPYGQNIMAAEWTYLVSYSPARIAALVGSDKATYENIRETKEFGVNIASINQSRMSSISGNYTGKEVDKIGVLTELGFKFSKAKRIGCLMVEDSAMSAECRMVSEASLGDHQMFLGDIIETLVSGKQALGYQKGRYWILNENIQKPSQQERGRMRKVAEKHRKVGAKSN